MALLEAARASDLSAIAALLERCGLPNDDIAPHLSHFTVARDDDGAVIAVIGLEVHGALGLVRSLAVDAAHRGEGLARRLYATVLGAAGRARLERLYCLTTTAQGFFEMLGWRALLRDEVPQEIQVTPEFVSWGSDAICLMREMPRD